MSAALCIGITLMTAGIVGILLFIKTLPSNQSGQSIELNSVPTANDYSQRVNFPPQTALQNHDPVQSAHGLPYQQRTSLLTRAEQDFFEILRSVTPSGFIVYPQMRLASIVDVLPSARRNYAHFNRIQAKCVDFVLCDERTTAPRLVVELDDSSHNRAYRRQRDQFVDAVLASAGLPILHVRWQRQYQAAEIEAAIQQCMGMVELSSTANNPRSLLVTASTTSHAATGQTAVGPTCGQCRRAIRRAAKFCTHCGAALELYAGASG